MRNSRVNNDKRKKAHYMFTVMGYMQKDIAKYVGVAEKTITHWVQKYEWKGELEKKIKAKGGVKVVMDNFFEFVEKENADLSKDCKRLWEKYCQSIADL